MAELKPDDFNTTYFFDYEKWDVVENEESGKLGDVIWGAPGDRDSKRKRERNKAARRSFKMELLDIFGRRWLFFPILKEEHWTLLVVCNAKLAIERLVNKGDTRQKLVDRTELRKEIARLNEHIAQLKSEMAQLEAEMDKAQVAKDEAKKEEIKEEADVKAETTGETEEEESKKETVETKTENVAKDVAENVAEETPAENDEKSDKNNDEEEEEGDKQMPSSPSSTENSEHGDDGQSDHDRYFFGHFNFKN